MLKKTKSFAKKIRVAWLYPKKKKSLLADYKKGVMPDKLSGFPFMEKYGVSPDLVDPYDFPVNPFGNSHSLYSGMDIVRFFKILFNLKKYDIIFSVGETSLFFFVVFKQIFKIKFPPLIVWDPALTADWKIRYRLLSYILPRLDKILVIGKNQIDFIEKHFQCGNRCEVIPHWIDCDFFDPQKAIFSKKFGDYILTVGNDQGRDYETLIKVVEKIGIKTVFKTTMVNDSKKSKNILINQKYISFVELRNLYAGARFVVVPLHNTCHAGGINAIQEAMAMGLATIVSKSESIQDHVVEGVTSLLVEPINSMELENAIKTLIDNSLLCEKLGENGRKFVLKNFNSSLLAQRLSRVFKGYV